MTSAFTQQCFAVVAADVDAAFLERCHETVGKHGHVAKLRTCHVADGSTLKLPDSCVDIAFSYITLQHCQKNDALSLTTEAMLSKCRSHSTNSATNFKQRLIFQ